ncbi:hypothetical protein BOTCAL_0534g00070 [Botryotinia calthae]|uniref:Uncharacterized protein n=1 Tax=Botryotinia calthae TaxID=38488 RepID=A0A4Y8CN47_9HELO|nr:hypothetical protein BOTCAL_0534g00070 [Botryotinia calthae]
MKRETPWAIDRAVSVEFSDSDYADQVVTSYACREFNEFRQPIILKPGIMEQEVKGNEVIQRWGLPTPCKCKARDNTADVIVSAIEFWNPFALLKLLDLSVSQFYWSISAHNMDFRVKRSWQFVRVTLKKRALSYHIHDDGRWQLLGSECWGIEGICTMDHRKENWYECDDAKCDRILAGRLGKSLPWHEENLKQVKFRCFITTKDGKWIEIDGLEAAGGNATVADKNSTPEQIPRQSDTDTKIKTVTANATNTEKTDQAHLQGTKKRKRAVE